MPALPRTALTAYIGLGSNLGERAETLDRAIEALTHCDGVHAVTASPYYRSAPVLASGPDFINAVARLGTTLTPLALLDALQAIEQRFDRQRSYKNAPRTLDLDLLLYGDRVIRDERLLVPHPRMHERAFVLRPLLDLAPGISWPAGRASDLLTDCAGQDVEPLDRG